MKLTPDIISNISKLLYRLTGSPSCCDGGGGAAAARRCGGGGGGGAAAAAARSCGAGDHKTRLSTIFAK